MKTSKQNLKTQRKLVEKKIQPWLSLRNDQAPPSGWLKAIRGALGINARQLGERLGIEHAAVLQFEKREVEGKITLESIQKIARAMNCKVVYSVVPVEPYSSLEAVLDDQAVQAARLVVSKMDHTMRLEEQGLSYDDSQDQVKQLAEHLKSELDRSLWDLPGRLMKKKKKKAK